MRLVVDGSEVSDPALTDEVIRNATGDKLLDVAYSGTASKGDSVRAIFEIERRKVYGAAPPRQARWPSMLLVGLFTFACFCMAYGIQSVLDTLG